MIKVAIIGVGHWGPNLLRNFLKHSAVDKVYCYDTDKKKMESVHQKYPMVETVAHYHDILNNSSIDVVVVATPVTSHFDLAKQALQHGKHVLVEKPLTSTPDDGVTLVNLARDKELKLMVDHISVYNGAIRKIKEIIDSGELGEIMYFDAARTSQGLTRSDVNVMWDLAIHDLSILDFLLVIKPKAVSAVGISHFNELEDIAYMTLFFDNDCIAHVHVNWLSPIKVRKILICGTKKMIVFDDIEASSKIKVYNKSGTGAVDAPEYDTTEPLASVTNEFVHAIEKDRKPLTNGDVGLKIVEMLAAAERSIKNSGAVVELK